MYYYNIVILCSLVVSFAPSFRINNGKLPPRLSYYRILRSNRNNNINNINNDKNMKAPFMSKGDETSSNSLKIVSNNNDNHERNRLLSKASKLRKEVESLESSLDKDRKLSLSSPSTYTSYKKPVYFSDVSNSTWMVTFRFTQDPIDDNNNMKEDYQKPVIYYSGKIGVHFLSDGFTEMIMIPDNKNDNPSISTGTATIEEEKTTAIKIQKIWGWDVEKSNEDGLDYLLFSADVLLNNDTCDRIYFNARVDRGEMTIGEKKCINLNDGVVTVKREIKNRNGGNNLFWGVFNAGGILAQFRKVGYFSCKPDSF